MKKYLLCFGLFLSISARSQSFTDTLEYAQLITDYNEFFIKGDYYAALSKAEIINSFAHKIDGSVSIRYADSQKKLGICYYSLGDNSTAEPFLRKALFLLRAIDNKHSDIPILLNILGNLYSHTGDFSSAENFYNEAIEIQKIDPGELHPDFALTLSNLGLLYTQIGNFRSAQPLLKRALWIEKLTLGVDNSNYAKTLENYGLINYYMNDFLTADSILREALAINIKVLGEEHPDVARGLNNLGMCYIGMGNYKSAESCFKKSLFIQNKVFKSAAAATLNNLGELYRNLGDYSSAESILLQALSLQRIIGEDHPDLAKILLNLGMCYSDRGDYKTADSIVKKALNIEIKVLGEDNPYVARILSNLGCINANMGDYSAALKILTQSIKIQKIAGNYNRSSKYSALLGKDLMDTCISKRESEQLTNSDFVTLNNIGNVYIEMGDYSAAELIFKNAFEVCQEEQVYNPSIATLLVNLGRLNSKKGDYKSAALNYSIAFSKNLTQLSRNFAWLSSKERASYWDSKRYFFQGITSVGFKAYQQEPSFSRYAYQASLVQKALLLESTVTLNQAFRQSSDTVIQSQYLQLRSLRKMVSKMESDGSDKRAVMEQYTAEADSLDKILVSKVGAYATLERNLQLNWQDVQNSITQDEASIEFADYYDDQDSSRHYMAQLIRKGDNQPVLIGLCKESDLLRYSPDNSLDSLYSLLWKPLVHYLDGIKTIYYSPCGLLNNIPFHALYKEDAAQRVYLMDCHTLHQVTSTRYLAMGLKEKAEVAIDKSIALFGGVNYNEVPNAIADTIATRESSESAFLVDHVLASSRSLDKSRAGVGYLPGTKLEVDTIASILRSKHWQVDVRVGRAASENQLKRLSAINNSSILHIATHGFSFPTRQDIKQEIGLRMLNGNDRYAALDNPMLRSGLLFGGANLTWSGRGDSILKCTHEDGVLTADELSGLDLSSTKLAVLSACETGVGALIGSEGIFGLKRALKLAGVDNMIVSLWNVPDDVTMEMMTSFYEELSRTGKPVSSFEAAQKAMRLNYPNEPDKWAAFVFVR